MISVCSPTQTFKSKIEQQKKEKIFVAGRVYRLTITRQLVRMIHATVARLFISYS